MNPRITFVLCAVVALLVFAPVAQAASQDAVPSLTDTIENLADQSTQACSAGGCSNGSCHVGARSGAFLERGPVRRVFAARPRLVRRGFGRLFGRGCRGC
jgi:hypothetical protein